MIGSRVTPIEIGLLVGGRLRSSADRVELAAVSGQPMAVVHQAPPLLARRLVGGLRPGDPADRVPVLARAGELFATADLAGETPEEYAQRHSRATGLPIGVAVRTMAQLREWGTGAGTAVTAERAVRYGTVPPVVRVLRVRRGRTLAVTAPSNHPATATGWLYAWAHGYGVAVRPGHRDPFTPARLVQALYLAGGDPGSLALVPGPHGTAQALLDTADLGLCYGDEQTVRRYADRSRIAVHGPGRSKALVTGPLTEGDLDYLVAAVAADGGTRCGNLSAVFTVEDPAAVADRLAERLAGLPVANPVDPDAVLAALPADAARRLADHIAALGAADHSLTRYRDGGLAPVGGDAVVSRPRVLSVPSAGHPAIGVELPMPFVVVAPWQPGDGVAPLRDSLVVALLGPAAGDLACAALAEPTIDKVVQPPVVPWWTRPGLPHQGSLADFLLTAKAHVGGTR